MNDLLVSEDCGSRKVGLTADISDEMLEAALNAEPPAEAAAFDAEVLKGSVSYEGPAKTIQEMDNSIAISAVQEFFTQLTPADRMLSGEIISERREEEKRE